MISRTTWVLLILFVVLLGVVFYLQRTDAGVEAEATPTPVQQLLEVDEGAIQTVQIQAAAGDRVALERTGEDSWALTEPQADATDMGRAVTAISQLAGLQIQNTLASPPAAEAIGLAEPAYTITLGMENNEQRVIQVGSETPVGSGTYVQLAGEASVHIVSTAAIATITGLVTEPPVLATETALPEATQPPAETSQPGTPTP